MRIKQSRLWHVLGDEALDFYFEWLAIDKGPSPEAKDYHIVKEVMFKKLSMRYSEAEIMKKKILLTYDRRDALILRYS